MNLIEKILKFLFCTNVTLVTYNIHGLPIIITGDDTYKRINEIGTELNDLNPDVIHFQEDWTSYGHSILDKALDYTSKERLSEKVNEYSIFGSGLFSVSNFEEIDVNSKPYKKRYGYDDFWASKGYIIQRLQIPYLKDESIDFYNTHMDAQDKSGDKKARKSNAEELIEKMKNYSFNNAIIFAGDTNLGTDDTDQNTYKELLNKANLTDVSDTLSVSKKIDKILYRSSESISIVPIEYEILEDLSDLSDHKAIKVKFQVCQL